MLTEESAERKRYPKKSVAWYTVLVLMFAYAVSFIDRQILTLMVDPISADLNLTDTQFSLLHGLAFALFYSFLGIPIGSLADRKARNRIILWGILVWGLMTALCGLAAKFWQLFLARVGVGVGEAALSPAAYSLISDSFLPRERTLPMSIYTIGAFAGVGIAFVFGGWVVEWTEQNGDIWVPIIGQIRPWQAAFFIVASPTVLLAVLVFFITEPTRKEVISTAKSGGSIRQVFSYFFSRRDAYFLQMLALALVAILVYGAFSWAPAYLARVYGLSPSEIGTKFGLVVLIATSLGMLSGGFLADRRKSFRDSLPHIKLSMWATLLACPLILAAFWIQSLGAGVVILLLGICLYFLSFSVVLAPAYLQAVTPNEHRGKIIAIYLFLVNLIGLGAGPTLIAIVSDNFFTGPDAIGKAYSVVAFIIGLVAVVLLAIASPQTTDESVDQ